MAQASTSHKKVEDFDDGYSPDDCSDDPDVSTPPLLPFARVTADWLFVQFAVQHKPKPKIKVHAKHSCKVKEAKPSTRPGEFNKPPRALPEDQRPLVTSDEIFDDLTRNANHKGNLEIISDHFKGTALRVGTMCS